VTEPAVRLESIEKSFGATKAVDRASLELHPGRVHAIVGENGAGKSTLLKIAGGAVTADAGRVLVDGRELLPATPREAIRRGVAMVHQHFMLVPTLTGLENLALGEERTRFGVLDLAPLSREIESLGKTLSLAVPLDVEVSRLSIGERQRLELLRALRHQPKVLILDEPTAVLAPAEARAVLSLARKLAERGVAVALVTHHLDEVAAFADEVTVLRRGAVVAHHGPDTDGVRDVPRLAREAVGEEPPIVAREAHPSSTKVRLRIDRLATAAEHGAALRELSLSIAEGEIVGVAGVEGNGQQALELALAGALDAKSGVIALDGHELTRTAIRERRARGVAWIPSDRHAHGITDLPAHDIVRLGAFPSRRGVVDDGALRVAFADAVRELDVRPDAPALSATSFSGGNQQKLVVARELHRDVRVLIAAHPTRGVDVRAAATIRRALLDAARSGAAVLLISTDLDELRALADRIIVMRGGAIVRELPPDASVGAIGEAMLA
jgi:ABC-type uncharacterized transport system ATPase subunit